MQDEATRTRAYQPGSPTLGGGPAPGNIAALHSLEIALTQLNEATTGLMAAYRSYQGTNASSHGNPLGPTEVTAAAVRLIASGAHTVHAVTGRPDLLGWLTPGPLLQALGDSSAHAKILCHEVLRTEMAGRRALRDLALADAEVATIPVPPPAIVVVDRQAAIVADEPGGLAAGATLIHDVPVAQYLAAALESFWTIAAPLRDEGSSDEVHGDREPLSPADRSLLRLLADGMTQQDAARRLQLSARTISRRTAELKRRLRAASPLQAGLEAARRGWL